MGELYQPPSWSAPLGTIHTVMVGSSWQGYCKHIWQMGYNGWELVYIETDGVITAQSTSPASGLPYVQVRVPINIDPNTRGQIIIKEIEVKERPTVYECDYDYEEPKPVIESRQRRFTFVMA
jgi:hypothetical protein